eukprot:gene8418-8602_t
MFCGAMLFLQVKCSDGQDSSEFAGYQVQLWREVAADLGLSDSDWFFTCVDWTAMMADLSSPTGQCSFAAAGLKFSWPIYKSGFQVLIASHVEEQGMWAFARAFDWSVWLVLGATALIVSVLVAAVEALTYGSSANRKGLR